MTDKNKESFIPSDECIHKYPWALAAEAGAVSAFLTASSSVEATKRTLWTREGPLVAIDWMGMLNIRFEQRILGAKMKLNKPVQDVQQIACNNLSILSDPVLVDISLQRGYQFLPVLLDHKPDKLLNST